MTSHSKTEIPTVEQFAQRLQLNVIQVNTVSSHINLTRSGLFFSE